MEQEMQAMEKNLAWELCELPHGFKTIDTRWVYKEKHNGRHRARLVARGFKQLEGLDYDQTYAPVVRQSRIGTEPSRAEKIRLGHGLLLM